MGTISDDLRTELCQVWALGFLDAMKGEAVTDDDSIPSYLAPPLVHLAELSVDGAATMIAEVFQENPSIVYDTLYRVGYDLCMAMNVAFRPIEVNLN